jgi:hypothetical protein
MATKVSANCPVSEDDFDTESKSEAAHYAAIQANETERERQRQENKLLREQGKPTKALPKKIRERRSRAAVGSDDDDSEEQGEDEEDEEEEDLPVRRGRRDPATNRKQKKSKAKWTTREHEQHNRGISESLRYEGREFGMISCPPPPIH